MIAREGDYNQLRKIFLTGNRTRALIMFPICLSLLMLGKSVIEAWVSPRYVASYSVLVILIHSMHALLCSVHIEPPFVWHEPA